MAAARLQRAANAPCSEHTAMAVHRCGRPEPGPADRSVFLAKDIVFTRNGQFPVSALVSGMELLTRSGFRPLLRIECWQDDQALMELPATVATGGRYVGDPRRYMFVCGAEVELATGAVGGLLYLADLWPMAQEAAIGAATAPRYSLWFARPEIVLSQTGDLASAIDDRGCHILTSCEAMVVFWGLTRRWNGAVDG